MIFYGFLLKRKRNKLILKMYLFIYLFNLVIILAKPKLCVFAGWQKGASVFAGRGRSDKLGKGQLLFWDFLSKQDTPI